MNQIREEAMAADGTIDTNAKLRFLVAGDVYRRDEIDASHYPVFHQMEGVKVFGDGESEQEVLQDLKTTLEGVARVLFGNDVPMRWNDDFFPFTDPSLELEVMFEGEWMEVLGCGVMEPKVLEAGGFDSTKYKAWAFGFGLERLAMVLFQIPDIRYFWSTDERFWNQFKNVRPDQPIDVWPKFQVYSKYPPCFKDISFWLNSHGSGDAEPQVRADADGPNGDVEQMTTNEASDVGATGNTDDDQNDARSNSFHQNDLFELVRGVAGDLVESVELIDQFVHPKNGRESHCYRIMYRSMERSLTNEEIDGLQEKVREASVGKLGVELR